MSVQPRHTNVNSVKRILQNKKKAYSPATCRGGAWGERMYSSYSFLTSAVDGVSGQRHAPAALCHRGKDPRYPCRGSNPDRPVVQSVVRNYIDWATPAHILQNAACKILYKLNSSRCCRVICRYCSAFTSAELIVLEKQSCIHSAYTRARAHRNF
jgi:hypothetical protein